MADQEAKVRLIARNDTAANWSQEDPVLLKGELGVETDTGKFKIGDGVKAWNALQYAACSAENVTISAIDGLQASNVQEAIAANFQSVVDGKKLLETAVTDKGGTVSKAGNVASFNELSSAIAGIPSGGSGSGECVFTFENYAPDNGPAHEVWENLSFARYYLVAASVGAKAIFAGGIGSSASNAVDAYGTDGTRTSFTNLSVARYTLAAVAAGEKGIFAGGYISSKNISAAVDAYSEDGKRTSWANLSVARYSLAAAAAGTKAIFAGDRKSVV